MLLRLLKPIFVTTLISSSVSLLFCENILGFFKYFFFVTISQIILFNLYRNLMEVFAEKIKNERIKEFSKQGLEVTCPCYMSKKMFIPIELGTDNSFNCLECKKDVAVEINANCYLKTDVINLDSAEVEFIKKYKEVQEK